MKKIVTLVLALALVLSLATVAFAATNAKVGEVYSVVNGKIDKLDPNTVSFVAGDADDKTVDHYTNINGDFAIVEAKDADWAVYTANGWVYLKYNGNFKYDFEAKNIGAGDKNACGKFYAGGRDLLWTDTDKDGKQDDDEFVAVAKTTDSVVGVALVNGKLVDYTWTDVAKVSHEWKVASYAKDGLTAATYKCSKCGAVAKVVTKADWLAADKDLAIELDDGTLLVITSAGANKDVNSSKTFDAGVAMYVGLSLASVAGSAVVIGKKKEF